MEKREIKPDYQFVKVNRLQYMDAQYVRERGIVECGVIYLVDANLHVHICSLTPSLEAWPMQGYATFASDEAAEKDEGETEMEMTMHEEPCSYFDVDILKNPTLSAAKYVPEREEDEKEMAYRMRVADEVRDIVAGNPVWF